MPRRVPTGTNQLRYPKKFKDANLFIYGLKGEVGKRLYTEFANLSTMLVNMSMLSPHFVLQNFFSSGAAGKKLYYNYHLIILGVKYINDKIKETVTHVLSISAVESKKDKSITTVHL